MSGCAAPAENVPQCRYSMLDLSGGCLIKFVRIGFLSVYSCLIDDLAAAHRQLYVRRSQTWDSTTSTQKRWTRLFRSTLCSFTAAPTGGGAPRIMWSTTTMAEGRLLRLTAQALAARRTRTMSQACQPCVTLAAGRSGRRPGHGLKGTGVVQVSQHDSAEPAGSVILARRQLWLKTGNLHCPASWAHTRAYTL